MKYAQDMLDTIGLGMLPEFLQKQFLADVETVILQQSLSSALLEIDEKRADTLTLLLEASATEPENTQKERAVWQYLHDAVPEFEKQFIRRSTALYAKFREDAEAREAEQ